MPTLPDFVRTQLPSFLCVKSIVSVLHLHLDGRVGGGEAHDFPEIMYVNSGHHTLKVDGVPYAMEPGQMILYKPHSFHESHLPSTATLSVVSFEAELPEDFSFFYNRAITLTGKQQQLLSRIISQGVDAFQFAPAGKGLRGMIPRADVDVRTLQQLKNQLELFLIDLYTIAEPLHSQPVAINQENLRSQQLALVTDYMAAHLSENLTLSQIAQSCSMSIPKLKQLFREQCGCGPIHYFTLLKIREAKKMICDSSMNFTEIARQLGFGSVHYFSTLFKERTGMTPSEYAKSLNKL